MPTTSEARAGYEQRKNTRPEESGLTFMFQVIRQMAGDIAATSNAVISNSDAFKEHMVTEEKQRQEVSDRIQALSNKIDEAIKLKEAFPEVEGKPDIRGHRVDHETRIESSNRTNKLWDKVREELVTNIVRGVLLVTLFLLALGFKEWLVQQIKQPTQAPTIMLDKKP